MSCVIVHNCLKNTANSRSENDELWYSCMQVQAKTHTHNTPGNSRFFWKPKPFSIIRIDIGRQGDKEYYNAGKWRKTINTVCSEPLPEHDWELGRSTHRIFRECDAELLTPPPPPHSILGCFLRECGRAIRSCKTTGISLLHADLVKIYSNGNRSPNRPLPPPLPFALALTLRAP